jgi:glycosyltransferase involved in cell wall biosynthesis
VVAIAGDAVPLTRRALVVGPTPPPYAGVEVMTENVLACRDQIAGWRLSHCDTQKPGGLAGKGALTVMNIFYSLRTWTGFVSMLLRERPQLVHMPLAQNTLGFLRDALLLHSAKAFGARVLVHGYGGDFRSFADAQPAWRRRLIRWTLGRADRAAIIGPSLARQFHGYIPDQRLTVIPNCIAVSRPAPSRLRDFPPPPAEGHGGVGADFPPPPAGEGQGGGGPLTVLFLGKISVSKGAVVFVKAAAQLLRAGGGPKLRFRMVGDLLEVERNITFITNPHGVRAQLDEVMNQPRSRDGIVIDGALDGDAKWEAYAQADIFVAPSYAEGFPLTILEAMSMGLPVVATDVGAIRESIGAAQEPFVVPPGDVDRVAQSIAKLAGDPDLRARLGAQNRRLVESAYDLRALARHLQAAYNGMIAPQRSGPPSGL